MLLSCDEGDTGAKHIVDEADKVLARLSLTTLFIRVRGQRRGTTEVEEFNSHFGWKLVIDN